MRLKFPLIAVGLLFSAFLVTPGSAEAGGGFRIGVGSYNCFGPGCYGYYRPYYRRFYGGFSRRYYRPYPWWGPSVYYRPYNPPPRVITRAPPPAAVQPAPPPEPRVAIDPATAFDRSYCREYSRSATVDGQVVEVYGTACRQADGSWRIIN